MVVAERGLDCACINDPTYPPQSAIAQSPSHQVPFLVTGETTVFGSPLIVDHLMGLPAGPMAAANPPFADRACRPDHALRDAQVSMAAHTLLSALVLRTYLIWTRAEHQPGAPLPIDLAARELARAESLLDWLDGEATPDGFIPGVFSVQDAWLIATVEWTDARLPIGWRNRPRLDAIQRRFADRPSVIATRPKPWQPGGDLLPQ